ncbi:MAG: hypothetical protein Ct9H300mP11_14400 [Chloroflexota bacterium]|nr:MAG: hypothetical protein Ct9H300mP11_14400 [Chloroflexota bacterium]
MVNYLIGAVYRTPGLDAKYIPFFADTFGEEGKNPLLSFWNGLILWKPPFSTTGIIRAHTSDEKGLNDTA